VSVVFRADGIPVESQLDYWQEVVSSVFMPIDLRGDFAAGKEAEMRSTELGPVRLNDSLSAAPFRTIRTARLIRSSTPDVCLVGVLVDGRGQVQQDDRQARLWPGDLSVVDPGRPSARDFTAMHTITVSIPKTMIPLRDRELASLTGMRIPGDRGTGALASGLVQQLASRVDQVSAQEAALLGGAVVDTVAVALAGRLDRMSAVPGARERTLVHRVRAFVDRHLADPDLSPPTIAAEHHVSLRQLHKVFEPEAVTVGDWIRRRRLERCRRDLLDPLLRDRPVAAIAARWGLPNPAHFNRTFRAAYGLPPAAFRARAAQWDRVSN
jgi:AraC-like DNA-binding protein